MRLAMAMILMSLLATRVADAQSRAAAESAAWQPRSYPELRSILQTSQRFSEPIPAPPAATPTSTTDGFLKPLSVLPEIPATPPTFSEPPILKQAASLSPEPFLAPAPALPTGTLVRSRGSRRELPDLPPVEPEGPILKQSQNVFSAPDVEEQTVPASPIPPRSQHPMQPPPRRVAHPQQQNLDPPLLDYPPPPPMDSDWCDDLACDAFPGDGACGFCETNPCGHFKPFADGGAIIGSRRVVGLTGLAIPLGQDRSHLLFADLRGQFDDLGAEEANFGLVWRGFLDPWTVYGAYIYYDVLGSTQDNVFHQVNIGMDILTVDCEFHLNGYLPGSDGKSAPNFSAISNGTVVTRNFSERAYPGVDAEFGNRFLSWGWNDRFQLHWFLGAYYFEHENKNYPAFGGPLSRLEFRVFDLAWFGDQSRFDCALEATSDRLRNQQIAAYLRLRIPLGPKCGRDALDPLRRRMVDLPIRGLY